MYKHKIYIINPYQSYLVLHTERYHQRWVDLQPAWSIDISWYLNHKSSYSFVIDQLGYQLLSCSGASRLVSPYRTLSAVVNSESPSWSDVATAHAPCSREPHRTHCTWGSPDSRTDGSKNTDMKIWCGYSNAIGTTHVWWLEFHP